MSLTPSEIKRATTHALRRSERQIGDDLRRMRLDAGISLAALGAATGRDPTYIARIESGSAHPTTEILISLGIALGAELSRRYFPGSGPRIHDRFQARMLETLLQSIDARWRPELEVAITRPSRGVIDAVLFDHRSPSTVVTEVYSDLRRLEQQIRWIKEKAAGLAARDALTDPRAPARQVTNLLVLRSTVATRAVAREFHTTLATAYPARSAEVFAALTTPDAPWPGSVIVWIHLHGAIARLMRFPPPGVLLGR